MELKPGDDTYEGRAHSLAALLRTAADVLDRYPETYLPYERREITLWDLVDDITDGTYDPHIMDMLLGELLDDD